MDTQLESHALPLRHGLILKIMTTRKFDMDSAWMILHSQILNQVGEVPAAGHHLA